jgi:AcrR family transcriptional regulator
MGSKTPRDARQAVLESAITEFAHRGYSGTSVQDILKATGLSKPTLYYYFESKAGLFKAILEFAYDECLLRMENRVNSVRGSRARLVALAAAMFEFAEENPQLLRLVFSTAFAAPEEIPAECVGYEKRRRNFEYVKGIVEDALKMGELDKNYSAVELTHGLYGAISHKTRMHLLCSEGKLNAKTAERVVDLFLNGAKNR